MSTPPPPPASPHCFDASPLLACKRDTDALGRLLPFVGGRHADGDVAAGQTPNVPSLELDGPAAWAASNASLSMSARLGMLVDSRKRMLENADTDEERAVIQSELAALTARRDDVARLERLLGDDP